MTVLIETPLRLERLDDTQAVFIGSAEETRQVTGIFGGSSEVAYRFPYVAISRDVWEGLGAPVNVSLKIEESTVREDT